MVLDNTGCIYYKIELSWGLPNVSGLDLYHDIFESEYFKLMT